MKQFVLPDSFSVDDDLLRLKDRDFHYLIRVRRYSVGDRISGINRDGQRFILIFHEIGSDWCDMEVSSDNESGDSKPSEDNSTRIVLIPGITRGKKMDLTVRQAVEAGASEVLPAITDHSQIRYRNEDDAGSKQQRWDRIATEALQQCGGKTATRIGVPEKLNDIVRSWESRGPLFFLHEKPISREMPNKNTSGLFPRLARPVDELAIIVGPEGGLSSAETQYLIERDAIPIYLGSRVLRAETAALYGLAIVATIIREKSEWHLA